MLESEYENLFICVWYDVSEREEQKDVWLYSRKYCIFPVDWNEGEKIKQTEAVNNII